MKISALLKTLMKSIRKSTMDDVIEDAKDIVDDLHVDYVTLLPTNEIKELFKVQAFPCTYFFNDKREVLGEPIFGVALSEFPAMVDKYLADVK